MWFSMKANSRESDATQEEQWENELAKDITIVE
jgi:hypothetical protein